TLFRSQVGAATRAQFLEDLIGLRRPEPTLFGGNQLPRGLTFGIAGARQELPEAAALHRHRLAAVLARFDFFLAVLRFRFRRLDLARVGAVGITAARDEQAELADAFQHRLAAFVARLADFDPFLEID